MHVALLANTAWLDEELASLRYLTVGLIDEQVRVAQVVPDTLPETDSSAFGARLPWRDSSWPVVRRQRLGALAEPLEKLGVDLIHALHADVWDGAMRLAESLDIDVVLTASGASDLPALDKLAAALGRGRVSFAATTEPMASALRQRLAAIARTAPVVVIRPGVHLAAEPHKHTSDQPLCAVINGAAELDDNYEALFTALRRIAAEHAEAQFFLDGRGGDLHVLWQAVQRHDLLSNLSLVPRRLGHREIELSADALIHPQAIGRSRSLTLAAMARGVPVVAHTDPWLDYLIDNETAWLIDDADDAQWERLVRRLIAEPQRGRELGQSARDWVGKHHVAAQQVADTLALYRRATGEAMRFPG